MREAVEEALDCLGSEIAVRIAEKKEIPAPSRLKRGQRLVAAPLWIAGKLAVYLAMRERKVSNSELARRLGVRETVVRRMLDPGHETRSEKRVAQVHGRSKGTCGFWQHRATPPEIRGPLRN